MNLKHLSIIFIALCVLFLSIAAISASENITDSDIISDADDESLEQSIVDTVSANESSTPSKDNNSTSTSTNKIVQPKKAKATAPEVCNIYKKKGSFKITIKDTDKKIIKKLKLKVKVYTGKKTKTYTLKTNAKGIATLSTKNLKKGTHKVVISSGDSNYTLSKKSYIHIGVKKYVTLKLNKEKNFKNGDYFRFFKETKNAQYKKGVYVENLRVYNGNLDGAKSHHIIKVKYTFKNIKAMKIIKYSTSKNMFKTKLIIGYEPVTAKITYIQE